MVSVDIAKVKKLGPRPGTFVEDERGLNAEVDYLAAKDSTLFKHLREVMNDIDVAYVATYPPRECGIATFTKDLSSAIDKFMPFASKMVVARVREMRSSSTQRMFDFRFLIAAWTATRLERILSMLLQPAL